MSTIAATGYVWYAAFTVPTDHDNRDHSAPGAKLFGAGWVLVIFGMIFAPAVVFFGAWVGIVGMVWAAIGLIYDKGRDRGRNDARRIEEDARAAKQTRQDQSGVAPLETLRHRLDPLAMFVPATSSFRKGAPASNKLVIEHWRSPGQAVYEGENLACLYLPGTRDSWEYLKATQEGILGEYCTANGAEVVFGQAFARLKDPRGYSQEDRDKMLSLWKMLHDVEAKKLLYVWRHYPSDLRGFTVFRESFVFLDAGEADDFADRRTSIDWANGRAITVGVRGQYEVSTSATVDRDASGRYEVVVLVVWAQVMYSLDRRPLVVPWPDAGTAPRFGASSTSVLSAGGLWDGQLSTG